MIADGLTKDKADPIDLLRSCVRQGRYQISPEELILQQQSEERERRKQKMDSVQKDFSSGQQDRVTSVTKQTYSGGCELFQGSTEDEHSDR